MSELFPRNKDFIIDEIEQLCGGELSDAESARLRRLTESELTESELFLVQVLLLRVRKRAKTGDD